MKQTLKNETDILGLVNNIQSQLIALDKKVDMLINRSLSQARLSSMPQADHARSAVRSPDHNKERMMYTAICADCNKECKIPFKPTGDRPVYCQDCFSRRKVINLSGIKVADRPKEVASIQAADNNAGDSQKSQLKRKKQGSTVKKPAGKKKTVPKKK